MKRDDQLYTPLFCEENVWHLARRALEEGAEPGDCWVLFFTNPARKLLMLEQGRGAAAGEGLVVWDYHVVLRVGPLIHDLDTRLPFPLPAVDYLRASFPEQPSLPELYRGFVRAVPAAAFLERFCSDRGHMVGVIPPEEFPPWPKIQAPPERALTLADYLDLEADLEDGSWVLGVSEYRR